MKAVRFIFGVFVLTVLMAVSYVKVGAYAALTPRNTDSKSAPSCGDEKPSAPDLYYTEKVSSSQVKLVWSGVSPANSWTVAYGPGSGMYVWGYNNFGDSNTRSVTINDLPGGTYYFVVRANNGCMPGPFSSEASVSLGAVRTTATTQYTAPTTTTPKATPTIAPKKPTVPKTTTPKTTTPKTTKPGVQEQAPAGQEEPSAPSKPSPAPKPAAQPGFFQRIINFFLGLFGK